MQNSREKIHTESVHEETMALNWTYDRSYAVKEYITYVMVEAPKGLVIIATGVRPKDCKQKQAKFMRHYLLLFI